VDGIPESEQQKQARRDHAAQDHQESSPVPSAEVDLPDPAHQMQPEPVIPEIIEGTIM
jgi:hypothetical protein